MVSSPRHGSARYGPTSLRTGPSAGRCGQYGRTAVAGDGGRELAIMAVPAADAGNVLSGYPAWPAGGAASQRAGPATFRIGVPESGRREVFQQPTAANRADCQKWSVCHQGTSSSRSGSVPPWRAAAVSTAYCSLVFCRARKVRSRRNRSRNPDRSAAEGGQQHPPCQLVEGRVRGDRRRDVDGGGQVIRAGAPLAGHHRAGGEVPGIVGDLADQVVGDRQPGPAVAAGARDRAALAQVLPDRVRVGGPRGVGVVEIGGPVLERG